MKISGFVRWSTWALVAGVAFLSATACKNVPSGPVEPQRLVVKQGSLAIDNGTGEFVYPAGVVVDGDGGECSDEVEFSIYNAGQTDLEVLGVTLTAGSVQDFDVDTSKLPAAVQSLQTGIFTICLDPIAVLGARSATVRISTNDPDTPTFSFTVRGYGMKRLFAADVSSGDGFGKAVALLADKAIVASSYGAYVFYRDLGGSDNWGFVKKLAGFGFADSVAIGDDIAVVGSSGDDRIYLYSRDAGGSDNWGASSIPSIVGSANSGFGRSMALDGDTLAVGMHRAQTDYYADGAVRIFSRTRDIFAWDKEIVSSNRATQDFFGSSVALSGDTLMVLKKSVDPSRVEVAFFYRNSGGTNNWGEVRTIPRSGLTAGSFSSIALAGDIAAICTVEETTTPSGYKAGSVYVFERNEGGSDNWGLVKKIESDNISSYPAVSNTGDTLAVITGTVGTGTLPQVETRVMLYRRDEGGTDNWGEIGEIAPPQGGSLASYGSSVVWSGDTLGIGVPQNDPMGWLGAGYIWKP